MRKRAIRKADVREEIGGLTVVDLLRRAGIGMEMASINAARRRNQ